MLRYECRFCGASMESPASLAGKMERCPSCGKCQAVPAVTVPDEGNIPVQEPRVHGAACPDCGQTRCKFVRLPKKVGKARDQSFGTVYRQCPKCGRSWRSYLWPWQSWTLTIMGGLGVLLAVVLPILAYGHGLPLVVAVLKGIVFLAGGGMFLSAGLRNLSLARSNG